MPDVLFAMKRLTYGPISIEWAPKIRNPIAVDHERLNGECAFVTDCPIYFHREALKLAIVVPEGFRFDGASIPRIFWCVPGFAPMGKHLWAALLHDFLCVLSRNNPAAMDRELADAIFASLLKHTGVVGWRRVAMDLAVSGYRRWLKFQEWRHA